MLAAPSGVDPPSSVNVSKIGKIVRVSKVVNLSFLTLGLALRKRACPPPPALQQIPTLSIPTLLNRFFYSPSPIIHQPSNIDSSCDMAAWLPI